MRRYWLLVFALYALFTVGAVHAEVVTCSSLKHQVTRPAWLSIPNSRIVLNPNAPMPLPASWDLCTSLPVNPAYFVGEHPVKMPGLISWYWQSLVSPGGPPTVGPKLDLSSPDGWDKDNLAADFRASNEVKLTVGDVQTWGILTKEVTVNLDESPRLSVDVSQLQGTWCIKVNSGKEPADVVVMDGEGTGGFVVDVPELTGWHGAKTFRLRLFACGEPGSSVTFSDVRFVENRLCDGGFEVKDTAWYPHQIVMHADHPGAKAQVETTTALMDESTIAQRTRIIGVRKGSGVPMLVGRVLPGVTARWDAAHGAVILQGANYHIAISAGKKGRWRGTFPSIWDSCVTNTSNGGPTRIWAIGFDDPRPGDEIVVTARFAPTPKVSDQTAVGAASYANPKSFASALKKRENAWNGLLSKVPRPMDFGLHELKRDTVTPDDIRRSYYRAWAFILSNVIPPMPENKYSYPQVGCGKPSLWEAGHPRAYNSAQWESIIAMQFLAWVDPKTAWDAYEGMLTLVDQNGSMGGECLPAHHANTAWVLYSLTGDRDRLKRVYPTVKKWLVWKAENPRWTIGSHDPGPQAKSAEFLSHALMDMAFAGRIAGALDMPDEQASWSAQIRKLGNDYRTWFWETPGGTAFLGYDTATAKRSGPGEMWTLQALALPPDVLGCAQRESLLKQLRANWIEEKPFILWNSSRYPNYMFAMRGMWQYGTPVEAAKMAEAVVSAVADAGEFAEVYGEHFPVGVSGVWPSVFGAENAIDGQLWHNGVAITDGLPVLVHMPNAVGVENLRWKDGVLNVRYSCADIVELSGSALRHLKIPDGFIASKADGETIWHGDLTVGEQIALEVVH